MSENKFSKYILYAIGEILLVVIGILIALNVNNVNERRKQEVKITEAFKEIHLDLSEDIIESNGLIKNYSREDSIINILMTKKMSSEDFNGFQGFTYAFIAGSYYDLKINDNGYELLMSNSDNIPKKYQPLLKSLKKIYINDKNDLVETHNTAKAAIQDYLSHLKQNTDWFNEVFYHNKITPKAIDFFCNSHYFKNQLTEYYALSITSYYGNLYQFRIDAEEAYQQLTSILQLEDLVASDSTYYSINVKDYEHFLGTYEEDSTNSAKISIESDQLFYQWKDLKKVKLFPISKNSFITEMDRFFNNIVIDSTGHALSYNFHFGNSQASMKKTD